MRGEIIMDCFAEIREIIAKELALEEKEIVAEANLLDDLGADSLGILNLADAISSRYRLDLRPDDIVDMKNVGELARLVESRLSSPDRA
jgi:acyl carrier protein